MATALNITSVKVDNVVTTSGASHSGDKTVLVSFSKNFGRNGKQSIVTFKDSSKTDHKVTINQAGSAILTPTDGTIAQSSNRVVSFGGTTNASKIRFYPLKYSNGSWVKSTDDFTNKTIQGYFNSSGFPQTLKSETAPAASFDFSTIDSNPTMASATPSVSYDSTNKWVEIQSRDTSIGKDNSYPFSIPVSIPANTGDTDVLYYIRVEAVGDTVKVDNSTEALTYTSIDIKVTSSKGAIKLRILKNSTDTNETTTYNLSASATSQTLYIDSNTSWTITF